MSIYDLPDIEFVDTNPEEIKNSIIAVYEAVAGKKLYPGDPVRLFLMTIADLIIQQRVLINQSAKMNLLRYATGDYLDQLGALTETPRLQAESATTTVRFTLSAPQPGATLIPPGTRVTPGNELYFTVVGGGDIPAGETEGDFLCECLESGVVGNGYAPGQINILVDPIPYVAAVANLTESVGGNDIESDDAYRERIYISPERFSVAGPTGAYEYWARTASKDISDVFVWSPSPGEVEIRPLLAEGQLPTQEVLGKVLTICNADHIRPLNDKVTVKAPEQTNYDIEIIYYIDSSRSADAVTIREAVSDAVEAYIMWQKSKIGRDIMPSELIRRIMNAGARRVDIMSPNYVEVAKTNIAIAETVNVTYGGLEDD
ncbi:baseplate J protein [Xylanibacillus composti]|uniref:Baseplate J/gp47 family protein n=1 Tax=Xylanibacillus composti TaxID=1572762 RepID=A0A8J4M229_9BACL|nr:baseplate J/gp47 family protein [Xylanibacillus composti]MDT9724264.1 baseplate J protein [Xylanibacillus composti]GIQ69259.1 hypothetical protein XYCOK13_20830 [Xylanibacillus composti]